MLGIALDLAVLVPSYALAATLLWRRRPWGYLLAGILLTSGVVHQIGYMVALPFQVAAGVPGATAFDPVEPVIASGFLLAAVALIGERTYHNAHRVGIRGPALQIPTIMIFWSLHDDNGADHDASADHSR